MLLILSTGSVYAAGDVCVAMTETKDAVYGFSPASLLKLEKMARMKGLDRFWALAKSDPKQSIPCLRGMLAKDREDSFFGFDGSQLLFSMDGSAESANVVATALARVDLADVRSYDYVVLAIEASRAGADISSAALNFARARGVDDYAVGVGTRMTREGGVVSLFGRLPAELAVINGKALHQSSEPSIAQYGLLVVALSLTPESVSYVRQRGSVGIPGAVQRQISSLSNRISPRVSKNSLYSRQKLLAMLRDPARQANGLRGPYGDGDFFGSALAELRPEDAPVIREARRNMLVDASLRSTAQYFVMTQILHVVETKAGLFDTKTQ